MMAARREKFGDGAGIVSLDWRSVPPAWGRQSVVAVGNFDGVHRGHAALVDQARQLGESIGGPVTIMTFDPHPLQLLAPERYLPPLTTADDRAALLRSIGADGVVTLQTDMDLLHLSPDEFFWRILVERFKATGLVEGFNFRFGHGRAGSVDTLREFCATASLSLRVAAAFEIDGAVVSSSRVRDALMAGDVTGAARLLNRPYHVRGTVVAGAKRGRTIGFPTANLGTVPTLLPADGVYAVRAQVGEQDWPGAANIGPNPTFGEHARKIEVHLLGFAGDIYGQAIKVDFVKRLRGTRPFAGAAELIEQLNRDVAETRQLLC
jgi:riboflavin kinase/FMN adenylyltransferase